MRPGPVYSQDGFQGHHFEHLDDLAPDMPRMTYSVSFSVSRRPGSNYGWTGQLAACGQPASRPNAEAGSEGKKECAELEPPTKAAKGHRRS